MKKNPFFICLMILLGLTVFCVAWRLVYCVNEFLSTYVTFKFSFNEAIKAYGKTFLTIASIIVPTVILLPWLLFFTGKLYCYISIFVYCALNGYRVKLRSIPFASIFGMKQSGDIEISNGSKSILVHFTDIPYRFRRSFVALSDSEYSIVNAIHEGGRSLYTLGIKDRLPHVLVKGKYKIKRFPNPIEKKQIYLFQSRPVSAFKVDKNGRTELFDGERVGHGTFFTRKGFIKALAGKTANNIWI